MSRSRMVVAAACLTAIASVVGVQTSAGAVAPRAPASTGRVWATVSTGENTCGIQLDHSLWCWGNNVNGNLGLGDTQERDTPTQVGSDHNWVTVRRGGATCGIRIDHTLWCWGRNEFGQLGLGDQGEDTDRLVPTQVGVDDDWADVQMGDWHTCGIRLDHTLWCWGYNVDGQLGLGDTVDRPTPTQVGTDTDWASVQPGWSHTCGTRTDHTLWCWGLNRSGQLGLGDQGDRHAPTQVGDAATWTSVQAGIEHTCGMQADHTLWCWGLNSDGQLGLGDSQDRLTPTQVGDDTDWSRVSGLSSDGTCATRISHSLWCWGFNYDGQLGLGDRTDRDSPTQVGTDTNWADVSAASDTTCSTRRNHSLWCWGYNGWGQLGNGRSRGHRLFPRHQV